MKYRKKPVEVEAVQWNVPDANGTPKLARDCDDHPRVRATCKTEISALLGTVDGRSRGHPQWDWTVLGVIDTLEGQHVVSPGDWVLKGVLDDYWAVKPYIFALTYEPIEE